MGANIETGDWILGHKSIKSDGRIVVFMQVTETMTFDEYFSCGRFEEKKPVIDGPWMQRVGDNMYYKSPGKSQYCQYNTSLHRKKEEIDRDLRHASKKIVFISGLILK